MRSSLHRHDNVPEEERRKAAFLTEYRTLCERHRLFAVMNGGEFVVADWARNTKAFEEVMQEMLMGDMLYIAEEEST